MAQAAGVSPSQPQAQDVEPRTKGSVMASTLIGAHAFEHLYAHSIPLLTTVIAADLGLGALQVGAIVAVRSIFGGLTSVSGGILVDLFHHRVAWVLSISTFMIGLGYLLMSIAPSYVLILAALALGSMGSALWHPPALGLLARRFPARRGLFISMHRSTGSIGDVLGPMAAGALVVGALAWSAGEPEDIVNFGCQALPFCWDLPWPAISWRWVLGVSTPIMFVATVLIFILLRNAGSDPPTGVQVGGRIRTNWEGMKDAFRGTGMWAIFTVSAVRGMADRSLVFLIPYYLTTALEENAVLAAAHVALMVGPGILAGPMIGALSDRIGRRPLIVFIMAATTLLTLGIIWAGQSQQEYTYWITIFVAIYGLMNFSVNNLTQAAAADIAAGRRLESSFLGLMWGNNTLFGAFAAIIIFGSVEWFDFQYGFYIAAGIYFVGLLVSLLIPGKPRAPEAVAVPA
ncbi:MAG: MFS transporter [Chloroflexi bacterium]|nr:MFS transporter [Chloroflexota bacterium]MYD47825.1 MFS transporter [Chloroflexota bacterium]